MNRKLPVDTQFDYDKLIDMKAEQLDDMVKECEVNIERIRLDIIKNYQAAQPYLTQMRILKQQLKKVAEKMEAAKTFLSMEKNGTLISNVDLEELKNYAGVDENQQVREPSRPESHSQNTSDPRQVINSKPNPNTTKFKSQLVTGNLTNKNREAVTSKGPLKKSATVSNLKKP